MTPMTTTKPPRSELAAMLQAPVVACGCIRLDCGWLRCDAAWQAYDAMHVLSYRDLSEWGSQHTEAFQAARLLYVGHMEAADRALTEAEAAVGVGTHRTVG